MMNECWCYVFPHSSMANFETCHLYACLFDHIGQGQSRIRQIVSLPHTRAICWANSHSLPLVYISKIPPVCGEILRVFRHACQKSFKVSPHTGGTCLRQCSRVTVSSADSSRVRQAVSCRLHGLYSSSNYWGKGGVIPYVREEYHM